MKTPHVYVTRAATLEYQRHAGVGFEQSRRQLTEKVIDSIEWSHARETEELNRQIRSGRVTWSMFQPRAFYLVRVEIEDVPCVILRVRVQQEGRLLVVTALSEATAADAGRVLTQFPPLAYPEHPQQAEG